MWSIPSTVRPRLCTIWTAVAPDAVLTRRTNEPTREAIHPSGRVISDHHPARRPRIPWSARYGTTGSGRISTSDTTQVKATAATLGLSHLAEAITELSRRAEADQMGYLDFVDLLLQEELGIREGRRFQYALRASALPHQKTLDQFNFAFQPDLDIRKINDLATLQFVQARANVAFLGPPGVGKTMLAVGLAVAACQAGFTRARCRQDR